MAPAGRRFDRRPPAGPQPPLGRRLDARRAASCAIGCSTGWRGRAACRASARSIVAEHSWTPLTFRDDLGATDGNAFAVEPTLQQSAYFRQPNRDRVIRNLYYVGGGTHPGAGLPGTLLTAEVTANLIRARRRGPAPLTRTRLDVPATMTGCGRRAADRAARPRRRRPPARGARDDRARRPDVRARRTAAPARRPRGRRTCCTSSCGRSTTSSTSRGPATGAARRRRGGPPGGGRGVGRRARCAGRARRARRGSSTTSPAVIRRSPGTPSPTSWPGCARTWPGRGSRTEDGARRLLLPRRGHGRAPHGGHPRRRGPRPPTPPPAAWGSRCSGRTSSATSTRTSPTGGSTCRTRRSPATGSRPRPSPRPTAGRSCATAIARADAAYDAGDRRDPPPPPRPPLDPGRRGPLPRDPPPGRARRPRRPAAAPGGRAAARARPGSCSGRWPAGPERPCRCPGATRSRCHRCRRPGAPR